MVEKSEFPQIWGIPPDWKFAFPPDLGESLKSRCYLTVIVFVKIDETYEIAEITEMAEMSVMIVTVR